MMPFLKLSPLQSRMAASLGASLLLFLLYLALSSPNFAYASELESTLPEDHNHERLTVPYLTDEVEELELRDDIYEPEFVGADRAIIGRQTLPDPSEVPNNVGREINVTPGGQPQYFMFTNASLHGTRSGPSTALPSSSVPLRRRKNDTFASDATLDEADVPHYLEGRQQSSVQLWITANTCLQPEYNSAITGGSSPAQLILYVSTSATNKNPGPSVSSNQVVQPFLNGFANYTLNATSNTYFSIYAPNSTINTTGVYSVQIGCSIDAPFHSYIYDDATPTPNLHLIDSDTTSALLVTDNLTSTFSLTDPAYNEWMALEPPPFDVFVFNQNNSAINGLSSSYCALSKLASAAGLPVQKSMTNITEGNLPKEQLYVQGLNGSSHYYGILAMGNSTTTADDAVIGGGGTLWQSMTFDTQSGKLAKFFVRLKNSLSIDGACAVIYNLSFCSSVAYAVPGNSVTFPNSTTLATWYDNQASTAYSMFNNVMAQIPCEIEAAGQYSLARTCDDCAEAYKSWLCTVTIPRCMDFTNPASFLQPRNLVQSFPNGTSLPSSITTNAQDKLYLNSSRNPNIDSVVKPGPYKEILPCADLCYDLVRSCPASMGFGCPTPNMIGFNNSYGSKDDTGSGLITCNFPGAVYGVSAAAELRPLFLTWACIAAAMISAFS